MNPPRPSYDQSRTVTEYIYLSTVLKYNFEGSVLYSSIIFGEYSWLYSSKFERQILYSLLHYISIHNREYPLLLLKKIKTSICRFPLKHDWIVQAPLIGTAYQQSPSAFRQSQLHGQIRWETKPWTKQWKKTQQVHPWNVLTRGPISPDYLNFLK